MPILYEHRNKTISNKDLNTLRASLQLAWEQRHSVYAPFSNSEKEPKSSEQRFLKISDSGNIKASNYVGFVQNGEAELIEIYPKIFERVYGEQPNPAQKNSMLRHIFFWLDYCSRWRYPSLNAHLQSGDVERLPEWISLLIGRQFAKAIEEQPFSMYQSSEETTQQLRGRINFSRYVHRQLATGNFQRLECDTEPFVFDNLLNRAMKYCARLMLAQTQMYDNQRLWGEVIFMLDEVEDCPIRAQELEKIPINPFFETYTGVLDSCRLILQQQLYEAQSYALTNWCLLLPMERIFEDFVAGFLYKHFAKKYKIEAQKADLSLSSNPKAFQMKHDLLISSEDGKRRVIIDTKYKVREKNWRADKKKGISQADMYQMLSYAYRRSCDTAVLLYPNTEAECEPKQAVFNIIPEAERKGICIYALEIPFWGADTQEIERRLVAAFDNFLPIWLQEKL